MKSNSTLHSVRENYRKQIRRSKINQIFEKVRSEYSQMSENSQDEQQQAIRNVVEKIEHYEFTLKVFDSSQKSDIQYYSEVQFILKTSKQDLSDLSNQTKESNLAAQKNIKIDRLTKLVDQQWKQIAVWEYHNINAISEIVCDIRNSWCRRSYDQRIVGFILKLTQCLQRCDKFKVLKQSLFPLNKPHSIIEETESLFNEKLMIRCRQILLDMTGFESDEPIIPYVVQISETVRESPYCFQVYLNLFLTEGISIQQKQQIMSDYLYLLRQNPNHFKENFEDHISALFVIYKARPEPVGHQMLQKLHLQAASIIEGALKIQQFKIEDCLVKNPFDSGFMTVHHICEILKCLSRESEYLTREIFVRKNQSLDKFMFRRLSCGRTVPELKCLELILNSYYRIISSNQQDFKNPQIQIIETKVFGLFKAFSEQVLSQSENNSNQIGILDICLREISSLVCLLCSHQSCFIHNSSHYQSNRASFESAVSLYCSKRYEHQYSVARKIQQNCVQIFLLLASGRLKSLYTSDQRNDMNFLDHRHFGILIQESGLKGEANSSVLQFILKLLNFLWERIQYQPVDQRIEEESNWFSSLSESGALLRNIDYIIEHSFISQDVGVCNRIKFAIGKLTVKLSGSSASQEDELQI